MLFIVYHEPSHVNSHHPITTPCRVCSGIFSQNVSVHRSSQQQCSVCVLCALIHVRTYIHTYICTYVYTYVCVCIMYITRNYVRMCVLTCVYPCTYVHIQKCYSHMLMGLFVLTLLSSCRLLQPHQPDVRDHM